MLNAMRRWKHAVLLAVMIGAANMHPIIVSWHTNALTLADVLMALAALAVFVVIFETTRQRVSAALVWCAMIAFNAAHYFTKGPLQEITAIAYHVFALLFFGFAVVVVLVGIFRRQSITTDDVLGTVCGYMLAGLAWANVYALIFRIMPDAFNVERALAWQLDTWQGQRGLFDYFSFVALTSVGFGDVTPNGPPAQFLTILETVFGQFYIAVVVAQLVGMRLAQGIREGGPDSR